MDWEEHATRAQARYEDGAARLPEAGDERQRQLTRMGNAAWAAGLSLLMIGRGDGGERVAPESRGHVPRELAGRAAGELGQADRCHEIASHRR